MQHNVDTFRKEKHIFFSPLSFDSLHNNQFTPKIKRIKICAYIIPHSTITHTESRGTHATHTIHSIDLDRNNFYAEFAHRPNEQITTTTKRHIQNEMTENKETIAFTRRSSSIITIIIIVISSASLIRSWVNEIYFCCCWSY